MREIEVLVRLSVGKVKASQALSKFGIPKKIRVIDEYFIHPNMAILKPDLNGKLKDCLRIRNSNGKSFMAFKKDVFDRKGIWQFSHEYETEVVDGKEIRKILDCLGFKRLVIVDNTKYKYEYDDYEIVLEDVRDLGLFLEVEYIGPSKMSHIKLKAGIFSFISSLGLPFVELNVGKPELLIQKLDEYKN